MTSLGRFWEGRTLTSLHRLLAMHEWSSSTDGSGVVVVTAFGNNQAANYWAPRNERLSHPSLFFVFVWSRLWKRVFLCLGQADVGSVG